MRSFLFIVILNFVYTFSNLIGADTLVYFNELRFNSPLEEQVFKDYFQNGEADYFNLFLAIDRTLTLEDANAIKQAYLVDLKKYKSGKFASSSEKKKIKRLYKNIHEKYFTKYELVTLFNDIYKNGAFNCLTGSAMYSLYLNDLNIPYVVKETPYHVYLLAYPNTLNLKIETTDPVTGYYNYDYRVKSNFVEHIRKNKIITLDEYNSSTVDELFNKYYFAETEISIDQLIGLHYVNHGAYLLDDKKTEEAFYELEKGYMFYPSEKTKFMLYVALTGIINTVDYEKPQNWELIYKLPRYAEFGISHEHVLVEFERLTQKLLVDNGQFDQYEKAYELILNNIGDKALKLKLEYVFNSKIGSYFYTVGKAKESFPYLEKAYRLNPVNIQNQSMFIYSIQSTLDGMSSKEMVDKMEFYMNNYGKLAENGLFKSLLMHAYLIHFGQSYESGSVTEAEKYRKNFEECYKENQDIDITLSLVERAYSEAGVYYFKKGNYEMAKDMLEKGMYYVPESKELRIRRSSF